MGHLKAVSTKKSNIEIHIIFIHGLCGKILDTWTNNGFFLPKELENQFPNVKSWIYGYSSSLLKSNASSFVPSISMDLIKKIDAKKEIKPGQKIAFIGHSLGGIVVKQLMRRLFFYRHTSVVYDGILDQIRGIAYLATPHNGSHLAETITSDFYVSRHMINKSIGGNILNGFIKFNQYILDELKPANSYLRELDLDEFFINRICNIEYIDLREKNNINIIKLIMSLLTNNVIKYNKKFNINIIFNMLFPNVTAKYFSKKVVDSIQTSKVYAPDPVDEDHFTISNPINRSSPVYVKIRDFVKKL